MPNALEQLVSNWRERHGRGEAVDAAEICRDHPELVDQLRQRIEAIQFLERLSPEPGTKDEGLSESYDSLTPIESKVQPIQTPSIPGYEIVGILGEGHFGVVYKARDLNVSLLSH